MRKKLLLGYDLGSSSIKASLIDSETGLSLGSVSYPEKEMKIDSPRYGWAEQHPHIWWENVVKATRLLISKIEMNNFEVAAIGISYQMHGLVLVDSNYNVLYPSIIWCDSRAVEIGEKAFNILGKDFCLANLLNSPGNFTASKLRWIKENHPDVFNNIYKMMLPGEYIAMKMTGEILTTVSGLSEGVFWNFKENRVAHELLNYLEIDQNLLPDVADTFSVQGRLTAEAAGVLGLKEGIAVSYRAGDQPNNAFSLNVLNPGEFATTAGTSGVVYGVTDKNIYDDESRVNSFAHVNYTENNQYKGILLCINGTGILNSWIRNEMFGGRISYDELNSMAASVPIGSNGVLSIPYGNGSERSLGNKAPGAGLFGINLNIHGKAEIARSVQEGIAFAFKYGIDIMKNMGMTITHLRAGNANMFLSEVFQEAVSNLCEVSLNLYNTDGSQGAARGAGIGAGIYETFESAFAGLRTINTVEPDNEKIKVYNEYFEQWKARLSIMTE